MKREIIKSKKHKPTNSKKPVGKDKCVQPMTGVIVDGEVFPFLMTCKEHDEFLEYTRNKK